MKTGPPRQARLSYLEVQTVIQHLQEQGWKDPSIRQIYTALNCRGSFRTLTQLKRQVLSQALPLKDNIVTIRELH